MKPIIHDYVLTMDKVYKYADVSKKGKAREVRSPLTAEMKKNRSMNGYSVEKAT